MIRSRQKGQGLTEFALILPLLLLLLLGIIEASRIIWAYVTVQAAAREATRYAVTGKPYILPIELTSKTTDDPRKKDQEFGNVNPPDTPCYSPEGEESSDASDPWLCHGIMRVEAIKQVAIRRGQTLSVSDICDDYYAELSETSACRQKPGAFGVMVTGQIISPTISLTRPVAIPDHAGSPGLNVQVVAFYNVQMLDPIYDALLGGTFVRVQGQVEMQNEGVERLLQGEPPPAIRQSPIMPNPNASLSGPNNEQIWALNGYTKRQGDELLVHLENHTPRDPANNEVTYDVYLENASTGPIRICARILPNVQLRADVPCLIDYGVPPGTYELYSTIHDHLERAAPRAEEYVVVELNTMPTLAVRNAVTRDEGQVWASNTRVEVVLRAHLPASQPYSVGLYGPGGGLLEEIAASVPALNGVQPNVVPWTVAATTACPPGGQACTVQTRSASNPGTIYAQTEIFINRPEIFLAGGNIKYSQGETMYAYLRQHTPGTQYSVVVTNMLSGLEYFRGTSDPTDSLGDTTRAVFIPVEEGVNAWPNGFYQIATYPVNDPGAQIALLQNIEISTPEGPYITIDGGYVWPIDSFINIKVHKHVPDRRHYLEFGPWRVPTTAAGNTFKTDATYGTAVVPYQIPVGATETTTRTFTIASYADEVAGTYRPGDRVATRNVEVYPAPVITVLEGDKALPDARITIRLTNHSPKSSYAVFYAGVKLFDILTDANGQAQRVYDLSFLNTGPGPGCTICYGIYYELHSQQNLAPNARMARMQFMIRPADLRITRVDLPLQVTVNTTIPVTLTIQNTESVTISRYFDVDFYLNPSPLTPAYQPNKFNFPGNIKVWQNSVPPGGSFTKTEQFFIGNYGPQKIYGYADTSDFIFGEPDEYNNVLSTTFTVSCVPPLETEPFNSLPSGWTTTRFGDGVSDSGYPRVASGRLELKNRGSSTVGRDDNATGNGHLYYHKTSSISTTLGLDVRVQVLAAPTNGSGARAGLSLRNVVNDGRSAKIDFSLIWRDETNAKNYRLQIGSRTYNANVTEPDSNTFVTPAQLPVWLRIRRLPNSNTFEFYYVSKATAPTDAEWRLLDTLELAMAPRVFAGVYNASFRSNQSGEARFDNFMISRPDSCEPARGDPVENVIPPGYTECSEPLVNGTFENAVNFAWLTDPLSFSVLGRGGFGASNRGLQASTYYTGYNMPGPYFAQPFQMLTWVTTNTTYFEVDLSKLVDHRGSSDANDVYYVAVYDRNPTPPATTTAVNLTTPVAFTNGSETNTWVRMDNLRLPVAPGVDLTQYAGRQLYIMFYNLSNVTCNPFTNPQDCHDTTYYFDDVNLSVCTQQALPEQVTTRVKGSVTVKYLNGTTQKISGLKVWAYTEGGQVHETFTIQDGEFNFYNLPAGARGTTYLIYAEHHVINPQNGELESLVGHTRITLQPTHTQDRPLTTSFTLTALTNSN